MSTGVMKAEDVSEWVALEAGGHAAGQQAQRQVSTPTKNVLGEI
jgi:hypothetical protein